MQNKKNRIYKSIKLFCILVIVFNLTFQGMALSVHLSLAHHSPGKPETGFHICLPSDTEDHHDCPVCRILSILHPSLAADSGNPLAGFLLHAGKVYTQTRLCFHEDAWIHNSRAPPCLQPET